MQKSTFSPKNQSIELLDYLYITGCIRIRQPSIHQLKICRLYKPIVNKLSQRLKSHSFFFRKECILHRIRIHGERSTVLLIIICIHRGEVLNMLRVRENPI